MKNRPLCGKNWGLFTVVIFLFLVMPFAVLSGAEEPTGETGTIKGVMYKKDGKTPLKDAQLILEEFEDGKATGREFKSKNPKDDTEYTDETGEYILENIDKGFYRGKITINRGKHYKIKKVDFFFHVIPGEPNIVSFSLKKNK